MEDKNCLFCKIVKLEIPSSKVYEDEDFFAFDDINPQAPTHVQIIPKTHISRISDLTSEDADIVGKLTLIANQIAKERKVTEGYRLVMNCNPGAGQSVFHVHLHLLGGRPLRWPPG